MRYNNRTNSVCFWLETQKNNANGGGGMPRNSWRVKPRFWLILIVLILSVFVFLDANQNKMIDQREAVLQELQKTKEDLEVRVASDQRKLEFSKSDDYIERMARIHLQMVMPNEILYVESDTH